METEIKYYTPSLEEWYIGFEYEQLVRFVGGTSVPEEQHCEEWEHKIAHKFDIADKFTTWPWIVRVKYLDVEDIESLGWVRESKDPLFGKELVDCLLFSKGDFLLYKNPKNSFVYISGNDKLRSAVEIAEEMGIDLMEPDKYKYEFQKHGKYDLNSRSWLKTSKDKRKSGVALNGRRDDDLVYVLGDDPDFPYDLRAFRGSLRVLWS